MGQVPVRGREKPRRGNFRGDSADLLERLDGFRKLLALPERQALQEAGLHLVLPHPQLLEALDEIGGKLENSIELPLFQTKREALVREPREIRRRIHGCSEGGFGSIEPEARLLPERKGAASRAGQQRELAQEIVALVKESDDAGRRFHEAVEELRLLSRGGRGAVEQIADRRAERQQDVRLFQAL